MRGLFEDDAADDDGGHTDEIRGGCHPARIVEQRAGDEADNGHLGAAGDEGGGKDGHLAVAVVFNGARGHHARHAAAGADQHGDEALARQAELAEDAVHDEGDTGHVAHVLQNGQHEEQHQHLRNKADHRAHAGDDAVAYQPHQPAGGTDALQPAAHGLLNPFAHEYVVGEVGHDGADGAHRNIVYQPHH